MDLNISEMSVLDRRRIEAMVLGPMIRAFEKEAQRCLKEVRYTMG